MGAVNREGLLRKLEEELRFCEECLRREARIELAIRILEDILSDAERARKSGLKEVEKLAKRARLLYHRAIALSALKEEEAGG